METRKIKNGLFYIPEILIMLVAIYWFLDGILGASYVNYLMLAIIVFILVQIILKNKIMAISLSAIVGLGSFYMMLAVLSEYNEFPPGSAEGTKLLLIGMAIFTSTLMASIIMPIKYFSRKQNIQLT